MVGMATCCAVQRALALAHTGGYNIASTSTYMCVPVTFFHSNGSQRLEVSHTYLSYEGRPDGLKASDARLEFETAQRYFDSYKPQHHVQELWAERQRELSVRALRRGGNHEKM